MINLLVYIIFILSVAFASAGVILSSRLRARHGSEYFSALLYYQVFIYTFGFYGIWGQVIIRTFLTEVVTAELLERFKNISVLLGLPFLIFGWLMLLRFSREISGRKKSNLLFFLFLLVNFLFLVGIGFIVASRSEVRPINLIMVYFIALSILYTLLSSFYILSPGNKKSALHRYESGILAFSIIIITVIQCMLLAFYNEKTVTGLIFIFFFFAGNSFLPLYLNYGIVLSFAREEPLRDITFDEFCVRYEISPRESDIIREICNGLSNKEISEKLFITVQTVKDHAHRIYIKTNVRSRVQLINLVKETKEKDPHSAARNTP